jgi:signal transduction histidine kinase
MRATGGTGTLRVRTRPSSRDTVSLTVTDDGPGVPPEHRERIFLPFFSGFTGENCPGLGLAACRGILRALGGSIRLLPEEGPGAVFRVELPVEKGVSRGDATG